MIEHDFDESEALCFLFFFLVLFFYNPSVIDPGTPPPPNPPKPYKGGEEVCSVCQESQRVCNNKPSISGEGRRGRCLKARHTQSDSLHCIVADYRVMTNCCPEGCFPVN